MWSYTSADRDIEHAGVTYRAIAISDSGMVQGGSDQNDLTITGPANMAIVGVFKGTPPSEDIWLTVRRMHFGEPDAPIYWKGTVTNVKRMGAAVARIIGQPLTSSFKRTGARLCWTRECPHFLYDTECKVDPNAYVRLVTVTAITGNVLTIDTQDEITDNYYRGGMVAFEINEDATIEHRMIEHQEGVQLTLFGLADGVSVGQVVRIYPGCDRTPQTCKDRFNNIPNYGGYQFMPGQTPFGTNIF